MSLLKKYKKEFIAFLCISVAYFLLRLIFIDRFPLFTDEAIYLRWAQTAMRDANWRFISLTDGKQPMFVWAAMVFMKFIQDPIIAGRFVSVVCGFFTMLGLWFLSFELFKSKKIAFLTMILYVFYPFAQVLDRMALYDSMVATFYIWALYFSILLVRRIKLSIAYTLGFVIGGGILNKSTNFFSIYLLPFALLLFDWKMPKVFLRILKLAGFAFVAFTISQLLYAILRLSPLFGMIDTKTATFVYPFSEWIKDPFLHIASNTEVMTGWLFSYLDIGYLFLIIISFTVFLKFIKEKILMLIYSLVPFFALCLFGKAIFPRFIFFMSLPLLVLAGLGLSAIISNLSYWLFKDKEKRLQRMAISFAVIVLFIFSPAFTSAKLAYDPINAKIPESDSKQYINGWTAGWGVEESVSFLKNKARDGKIFVATEGTFGLMPEALELYLVQDKNITIKGYWPVSSSGLPKEVLTSAKRMPTYFIFYQPPMVNIPEHFPLKLLFKIREGNSDYFLRFYQVVEND